MLHRLVWSRARVDPLASASQVWGLQVRVLPPAWHGDLHGSLVWWALSIINLVSGLLPFPEERGWD